MITTCHISERRACHLAGLSRDTYRHPPVRSERAQVLLDAIIGITRQRPVLRLSTGVRLLEPAARFCGYPEAVRTDQGPEFTQSHPRRAREKKAPIGRLEEDRHCGSQGGDGIISASASSG